MPTPNTPGPRHVTVFLAIVLLAACSSDGRTSGSTDTTVAGADAAVTGVLLTQEELPGVPGFEKATVQPSSSTPTLKNPDPRGPHPGGIS
jgi:hypothetical protein